MFCCFSCGMFTLWVKTVRKKNAERSKNREKTKKMQLEKLHFFNKTKGLTSAFNGRFFLFNNRNNFLLYHRLNNLGRFNCSCFGFFY